MKRWPIRRMGLAGACGLEALLADNVSLNLHDAEAARRFASRGEDDFQNRVLSAMWRGFGGHAEKP